MGKIISSGLSGTQYNICKNQQELYEHIWKKGYLLEIFSDLFMTSEFCGREMDQTYSHYHMAIPEEILDFCEIDITSIPITEQDVSYNCAGWCGFFYRLLVIRTGIPSRKIAKELPFSMLAISYPGLHTIDEEEAVEIIAISKGWKVN